MLKYTLLIQKGCSISFTNKTDNIATKCSQDHHLHLCWKGCDKTWHSMALVIEKFQGLGLEYFENMNVKSN